MKSFIIECDIYVTTVTFIFLFIICVTYLYVGKRKPTANYGYWENIQVQSVRCSMFANKNVI